MWGFEITGPSQWSFIECVSFFFFFFANVLQQHSKSYTVQDFFAHLFDP